MLSMKIPTPGFLFSAFIQVCRRFPGTILCTVLGTVACFALIDGSSPSDSEEFFARNWIVCQLGLPFLTALVVYSESKDWDKKWGWLLQAIGVATLLGSWFWLDTKAPDFEWRILPQYFALLIVMHLAVAVGPFLNARPVRDFWEYNRQLFANLVVGAAFTLILYAGLALAVLAVDNLFGFNVQERIYAKLFVLLSGIFNTAYFLFHFPEKSLGGLPAIALAEAGSSPASAEAGSLPASAEAGSPPASASGTEGYTWVFRNLCKYILIPIVLLYFVILYAYGAKIAIQWSLPKGWVSSLVIGFSVAGIFTYLLNFYLSEEDDSLLVSGFKRWFWWVVLPLTGLLFIAIGTRIRDYGVTEERFLVALLGGWLATACLYFLFSRNDNLKFIPISLALFALAWAFGPLSAFAVSQRSQKGILIEILERNGRFENGKMKPGTASLTEPEREQLSSAIAYLEHRNALSDLLPQPVDSAWFEYGGLLHWLKIESAGSSQTNSLSIGVEDPSEPISIRGFDMAYPVSFYRERYQDNAISGVYFRLSEDGKRIEWWQPKDGKSQLTESFNIEPALQKWSEQKIKGEASAYFSLPIRERSFTFTGRRGNLCWIAEDANVEIKEGEKILESSNGWVLLKVK